MKLLRGITEHKDLLFGLLVFLVVIVLGVVLFKFRSKLSGAFDRFLAFLLTRLTARLERRTNRQLVPDVAV